MRRVKATVAAGVAALLAGGGAIVALADGGSKTPACGTATPATVALIDGRVAERVYVEEQHGSETLADRRQVASDGPLHSALRSGNGGAVRAAVERLVYSHTHIVRLRVSRGSRLLADVGGPYILAPITGTLREGGRTLGRFTFSVQDDLGFIKLVTRFAGVPLVLRTPKGQIPVEGQAPGAPARIPARGPVGYRGATYEAYSFTGSAFPQGSLRISLLSPPRTGLSGSSCGQVSADETARVAARIARRFASLGPSDLQTYIALVATITGGPASIGAGGHTYVAGGSVPRRLPSSGAVTIGGRRWHVATVPLATTVGAAHVHVLFPG